MLMDSCFHGEGALWPNSHLLALFPGLDVLFRLGQRAPFSASQLFAQIQRLGFLVLVELSQFRLR